MQKRFCSRRLSIATSLLLFWAASASAQVVTEAVDYQVDGKTFSGHLAYDDAIQGKRPGILVVHEWWGLNPYARKQAERLAAEGYVAFAVDMYGKGVLAETPDEAGKLMNATLADMAQLEKRFHAARQVLEKRPELAADALAAVGYCYGGGVVLHMARQGEPLDGVITMHGSLSTQTGAQSGAIKTPLLVFTGGADPFVPAEQVSAFLDEMQKAQADLMLRVYPGVKHSFTNPDADNKGKKYGLPLAYDAAADQDSWRAALRFLKDRFAP